MSRRTSRSNSRKTYAARLQKRITGTVDIATEVGGNYIDPKLPVGGGLALGIVYLNRMVAEKKLIPGLKAYKQWRDVKAREQTVDHVVENQVLMRRLRKNHPHHDKHAHEHAEKLAEKSIRRMIPDLTPFISVVVKVVNQNNQPIEVVPGLREGKAKSSRYLYNVWKIIAHTLGKHDPKIKPDLIANTNGALSYYFLPIPWDRKSDVVAKMRRELSRHNLIPAPKPTSGPLSRVNFIEFQTFMHDTKIMPQLLITVVHPTQESLSGPRAPRRKSQSKPKRRRRGFRSRSKSRRN